MPALNFIRFQGAVPRCQHYTLSEYQGFLYIIPEDLKAARRYDPFADMEALLLDVVRAARERTDLPLAVYNVSGEYAMVKAAAERGWLDERRVVGEILTAFFRAGADLVITYHALDYAAWEREA